MSLESILQFADVHKQIREPDAAHLVIGLNEVLASRGVPGLHVETERQADGVLIDIRVDDAVRIAKPVHLCFGLLQDEGVQKIGIEMHVGEGAKIGAMAHCVFPNATDVRHEMDARIELAPGADYSYTERHIHSEPGGVKVIPKARVILGEGARYRTDFELVRGRVGLLEIDYETICGPRSVLEMTAKVSAAGDDRVDIRETGHLRGEYARGVLTSRVAVKDNARADVYNKLTASAAHSRGHVDCKEIIRGGGVANAVPVVEVNHPKAHVTHEAALGAVDTKQLETLMSRGLTEDEASDLIIEGLLS